MTNIKDKLREEFEKTFDEKYPSVRSYTAGHLQDFVCDFWLSKRDTELKTLLEKVEGMKKYHKEFECNGANNGKGCYETFCEDQNCRNAPKEYNSALTDISNIIKTLIGE